MHCRRRRHRSAAGYRAPSCTNWAKPDPNGLALPSQPTSLLLQIADRSILSPPAPAAKSVMVAAADEEPLHPSTMTWSLPLPSVSVVAGEAER